MEKMLFSFQKDYSSYALFYLLTLYSLLLPYGTAIKHFVPDRVKPSFVIFDMRALWRSVLSVRVPACQKLQMTA